jgi:hypothetical protein
MHVEGDGRLLVIFAFCHAKDEFYSSDLLLRATVPSCHLFQDTLLTFTQFNRRRFRFAHYDFLSFENCSLPKYSYKLSRDFCRLALLQLARIAEQKMKKSSEGLTALAEKWQYMAEAKREKAQN